MKTAGRKRCVKIIFHKLFLKNATRRKLKIIRAWCFAGIRRSQDAENGTVNV
jgi:hypothetical protein